MSEYITESLPWVNPVSAMLSLTRNEAVFVFLYSGQQLEYSGRYSYLALHPVKTCQGDHFASLHFLTEKGKKFDNAWFGYLGYELLHDTEHFPFIADSYTTLPNLWFSRFGIIMVFDHHDRTVIVHRLKNIVLPKYSDEDVGAHIENPIGIASISSPMSRATYLDIVENTKEAIRKGDFYQANITRKFTGSFTQDTDCRSLFLRLIEASPSAYSALIRMEEVAIISSSPECFLRIDSDGHMESRPIKGTAPRFKEKALDDISYNSLRESEKDRAENLMIVDLMRNDLARSCQAGSVEVKNLFEVSSYATLHHMASTVTGQKLDEVAPLDAVKNCFPPGSMTGAPKIRAIEWCMEQEKIRRGVYSGALGWFGGDGSCDLSVVIRTLIVQGNKFEFQVGGAITSGSKAEAEWAETMVKARGILEALGISANVLESL